MIKFASIYYGYFLVLAVFLFFFYIYAFHKKKQAMKRFGSLGLIEVLASSTSRRRQIIKAGLMVCVTALLIFALMRPQVGTRLEEVKREGQDIVIALDVSRSMLAEDIKPNRLEKAKHEIAGLIDRLEGDRIGLVAFAGKSFVQCPLTLDYGAAKMFLDIMDTETIPVQGTAISEAIKTSIGVFNRRERKNKILVVITDGEDHESNPLETAKEAKKEGIMIYTVGIGSLQGVPIPASASGDVKGFKKNKKGEVVISKLDELTLEKIALETNGKYYRATPREAELDKIYEAIAGMDKKELASLQFTQFEERFQYVLLLALFLLVFEMLFSERVTVKREWMGRFK